MRRNILGSSVFQSTLLFGLVITAVVSALFIGANLYRIQQIDDLAQLEIEEFSDALFSQYEAEGANALIKNHIRRDGEIVWSDSTAFSYLIERDIVLGLFDNNGEVIAGYEKFFGFEEIDIASFYIGEVFFEINVMTKHFEDGYKLGVGRLIDPKRNEIVALLRDWGIWVPPVTYLICLLLGAILGRRVQSRVVVMAQTAQLSTQENLAEFPELLMQGDEFDRLVVTFNEMTRRLQRLADNIEATSVGIAHDLRTPLTNIAGRLELMRDDIGDPEAIREHIEAADEAQSELNGMLEALLRLGEIRSGQRKVHFKPVDLSVLVGRICDAYRPGFEENRKTFLVEVSPNFAISGDRELIEMMISNLFENAIIHSRVGAKVFAKLEITGDKGVLTIGDDGPGISPVHRMRVFDRFYRAEQSRTTPGSGLGLSIVKAISELHSADIEILDHRPGTVFQLKFHRLSQSRMEP